MKFSRRLSTIIMSLALVASIIAPVTRAFAATNLMINDSVETLNANNQPTNWTPNSWGTNTATLSVANSGHTGSHSLTTSVSARTSGDAKWIPDSSAVTPGQSYDYSDYYIADATTELDAAFYDSNGVASYQYLTSTPATAAWAMSGASFVAPANAVRVSILHILNGVGTLTTDDFILSTTAVPNPTPNPSGNLISNPSFESANGAAPANWNNNAWGTNTSTFNYENTGNTGSRSASVTTTSYTNGDAKWYAAPVAVTPNAFYNYSDYYKSNVSTRVVAAYKSTANTTTYQDLAPVAASAAWAPFKAAFTTPANTASVTIFHVLDAVGTLSIDDVSIAVAQTPVIDTSGTIPNASAEQSSTTNPNLPYGWTNSSWGNNKTAASYVTNDGHLSAKSLKITVSNYVDGDAKWYFDPIISLTAGKQYQFSGWFKSNAQVTAVGAYTNAAGATQYFNMATPLSGSTVTTAWQQYKSSFTLPAGATSFTVYLLLKSNGWLQVDDYSLNPYVPAGFNQGLVSLTFDDGWQSIYTNGLPLLKKYDFKSTQYIVSGYIGSPLYMSRTQIAAFATQGSEIASHTIDHTDLTTLTKTQIDTQLSQSKTKIQSLFGATSAINFATPYGAYNSTVVTETQKYYRSHRSTDVGYNTKDSFNPYNILVQNIEITTTPAQVAAWVDQAKLNKAWLVLVYHDVDTSGDTYSVSPTNLDRELGYIKTTGIAVKTINAALDEITPQL